MGFTQKNELFNEQTPPLSLKDLCQDDYGLLGDDLTCIGKTRSGQCRNPINEDNRLLARDLMSQIDASPSRDQRAVRADYVKVVELCMCYAHKWQKKGRAEDWHTKSYRNILLWLDLPRPAPPLHQKET